MISLSIRPVCNTVRCMHSLAKLPTSLVLFFLLLSGCGVPPAPTATQELGRGKWTGQTFHQPFFGLTLQVPRSWRHTGNMTKEVMQKGGSAAGMSAMDRQMATQNATIFFIASRHPLKSRKKINAVFSCIAEKCDPSHTAKFYQEAHAEQIEEMGKKTHVMFYPKTVQLGGKEFQHCRVTIDRKGVAVKYDLYTTIINGYALTFGTMFHHESMRSDLIQILKSIRFN